MPNFGKFSCSIFDELHPFHVLSASDIQDTIKFCFNSQILCSDFKNILKNMCERIFLQNISQIVMHVYIYNCDCQFLSHISHFIEILTRICRKAPPQSPKLRNYKLTLQLCVQLLNISKSHSIVIFFLVLCTETNLKKFYTIIIKSGFQ